MNSVKNASIWQDIVWGKEHDLFQDSVSQAALRAYMLGERDAEILELIRTPVRRARIQEELGHTSPFRAPRLRGKALILGEGSNGAQVGLKGTSLNAGMLVVGNTGSGKSTLLKRMFLQVASQVKGLWISDFYKRDFRHLRPLLQEEGLELIVASMKRLKINLLQADGDPRTHLAVALDILQRGLDLPPRAMSILRQTAYILYEEFGIFTGSDRWPTLFDLYEKIRGTKGLNAQAREAILDRLGAALRTLGPEVAGNRLSWRPRDLAQYRIDWEMGGASESAKALLLNYLLFSTLYGRVERGASNAKLNLLIAFEDAQRFFSAGSVTGTEIPALDEIAGLIRGTGVGLLGACQSLQGLSKGLIPNLSTKIMGRLGSHEDYQRLGADMGMNAKQLQWARLNLRPGRFLVQVAEGAWRHPFLVEVPLLKTPPVVTDLDAAQSMRTLERLPVVPAPEFLDWDPDRVLEVRTQPSQEAKEQREPTAPDEAELRFLRAVQNHPALPSSQYAKLAGFGSKRAIAVRKKLVDGGFLREHKVATGPRGRNAIVLEITSRGRFRLGLQDPQEAARS